MSDIRYEVTKKMAVLSANERTGWTKEANMISWNGKPAKLDIRDWAPDHSKMSKGVTLTREEAGALFGALQRMTREDFG